MAKRLEVGLLFGTSVVSTTVQVDQDGERIFLQLQGAFKPQTDCRICISTKVPSTFICKFKK